MGRTPGGGPTELIDGRHPRLRYLPALDGLRAVAVAGVLAYHGGVGWLPGSFLGVDTFFVLSGFLITSLLIDEWHSSGTVRLRAFWARRARRLLPGLIAVVLFVGAYAVFVAPAGAYPGLRGDALSALFYVANWHFVLAGSDYFAQAGLVSPLTHTWSLAIEEQFYVVWPLVVLLALRWRRSVAILGWICLTGAAGSALEMTVLYRDGASLTRLYYGTDTHVQSLLLGAAIAAFLSTRAAAPGAGAPRGFTQWCAARPARRRAVIAGGFAGAVGTAALWATLGGSSPFLYDGGFLLAAAGSGAVLVSAVCVPRGALGRALSVQPVRYLGRISYGLYLWHYPLFIWLDAARTGVAGYPLLFVRSAVTVAVASASYRFLEQPIRRGALGHRRMLALVGTPFAMAVTAGVVVAATAAASVPVPAPPDAPAVPAVGAARAGAARANAARGAPAVKVLVIGDSTALTLGMAVSEDARAFHVVEQNAALLGCGVTAGAEVESSGTVEDAAAPCRAGPAPPGMPALRTVATPFGGRVTVPEAQKWTVWYRHRVAAFDPNVVVLLAGRWEVVTRTYRGRWTNILAAPFARYVRAQLERTVRLASVRGARVVLLTAPCYDQGGQPDGSPWPTDSPARVAAYNGIVEQVAADDPSVVSVFHLDRLVCPGGVYHQVVDGVPVRSADGVHFTLRAGELLGAKLWPAVVRVAREPAPSSTGVPRPSQEVGAVADR